MSKNKGIIFGSVFAMLTTGCFGSGASSTQVREISFPSFAEKTISGALDSLTFDPELKNAHFITNGGTSNDKSFTQAVYQGIKNYNGELEAFTPVKQISKDKFLTAYETVSQNYQLIIAAGFQQKQALEEFVPKDLPKNRGVIFVDGVVENKAINSIVFKTEEAAFFAGYGACKYLNKELERYQENGLKVGTFGGKQFPGVVAFMAGFQQGVKYFNENKTNLETAVEFISLGDKVADFFVDSFKAGDGKAISETLINKGADIILPVAGKQTTDTLGVIEAKKSPALVIGVDTDQSQLYNEYSDRFLTSIIKEFAVAVQGSIEHILEGKQNSQYGLGKVTVGTLENNLVGLATDGLNKITIGQFQSWKEDEKLAKAAAATKIKFTV